jgi:hypothetical protein
MKILALSAGTVLFLGHSNVPKFIVLPKSVYRFFDWISGNVPGRRLSHLARLDISGFCQRNVIFARATSANLLSL